LIVMTLQPFLLLQRKQQAKWTLLIS
jgi:hypothetical protein